MSVSGTAGGRIAPGVGANLIGQHAQDRNQDATVYVGNLDPQVEAARLQEHLLDVDGQNIIVCRTMQVSEELIWELFTQAGPVVNVYLPKDRVTNQHQGYGFVEFRGEEDADYAIKILNMIKMHGKPIRVNKASQDKKSMDVGANLFIGNLDPDVDEKVLHDTFSAFGVVIGTPKIMRDPDTGNSRGFGFISYDCFEASDAAIEAMNGQFLCNRPITVSYAFKKDTKGERHGTPAERLLAAQQRAKQAQQNRPHTLFATGPKQQPQPGPPSLPQVVNAPSGFAAGMPMPPPPPVVAAMPPPPPVPTAVAPPPPSAPGLPGPPPSAPWQTAPPPMPNMPPMPAQASQGPPGSMPPGPPFQGQQPPWAQQQQGPPPGMQQGFQRPPGMGPPPGMQFPPGMPPPPGMQGPPGMQMQGPPGMQMQGPPGMHMQPPPGMQMPQGMPPPPGGFRPFPGGPGQPPFQFPPGMPPPPGFNPNMPPQYQQR